MTSRVPASIAVLSLLLTYSIAQSEHPSGKRPSGDWPKLIASVEAAALRVFEAEGIPGAAVVLVQGGRTIYKRGFGYANLATQEPLDPDRSIIRIGSISKALSLLTLTRLIDTGRLGYDSKVADYIEGIRNPLQLDQPVRVKNLLTHTSGFDQIGGRDRQIREPAADLEARKAARPALRDYLSQGHLRRVSPAGLLYRYDTYGSSLAGVVLESVAELTYPDAMQRELFAPLGMKSSSVEVSAGNRERLAIGYEVEAGELVAMPYEVYVTTPASSVDATPADMGRLLEALTSDGANAHGRFVSEAMVRTIRAPQFRPHPEFLGTTHGLHESLVEGLRVVDHGGTMLGFQTQMAMFPDYGVGAFLVMNRSGGGRNPFARSVMTAIATSLKGDAGVEVVSVPARDKQRDLSEYVANYYYGVFNHSATPAEAADGAWWRGDARAVTQRDGALVLQDEEWLPRGDDVFVRSDGARKIFFGRNAQGAVAFFSYASSADAFEREDPRLPYVEIRSLASSVYAVCNARNVDAAVLHFRGRKDSASFYVREDELNNVGYALLRAGRGADAIVIFELIAENYPASWNAHDSLGEAYATAGEKRLAIASYRRSIELNPQNTGGKAALKKLQAGG